MRSLLSILILGLLAHFSLTGCATNPATGESQLALMNQGQEIAIGKQAHTEIMRSMDVLEKAELQHYVSEIGQRLAAKSERPDLPWTFTVIDDPVVNAFALPGGYIYITRGLLTYLTSEAELAGVLGHEIGHVTARHSVNQMSKSTLGEIGLGIGMLLYPDLQDLGRVAQQGLQLLFLKFSRDDEREADRLGLRYMTRLNYAPQKMSDVMDVLAAVSQAQEHDRMPTWLATHPAPEERRGLIQKIIADEQLDPKPAVVHQDEYMQKIDGLVFGENPRHGYFSKALFFHPDLQWQMEFPDGWATTNQRQLVGALSPAKDAAIVLSLTNSSSPETAALQFRKQAGVDAGPLQPFNVQGARGAMLSFQAQASIGVMQGVAAFISYQGKIYQIISYSLAQRWASYQPLFLKTIESFRPITNPAIIHIEPLRLTVSKLPRAMSLSALVDVHRSPLPLPRLAMINQVEPLETLPKGKTIKQVQGQLPPGAGKEWIY